MAFSSTSRVPKYDVFLSFRGGDTRKSFVSHLYATLDSRGIVTFKDDKTLEIGDHISHELRSAIEGSSIAVVVLSENYATSRWCLMELQLITERMKNGKLYIFPVFYDVDPSFVRHQKGCFALEKYQGPEMADTVMQWREALNLVASLSGVDSRNYNDESKMVRRIARDIAKRLTLLLKTNPKNIFGMTSQIECLISLLDLKSYESRMIGILGIGGIGKTTIAKYLYEQLSPMFPIRCVIENIMSICKGHDQDSTYLQKLVFCSIFHEDIWVWSVEAEYRLMRALRQQKVLLVLDGVDKVEQVHALAKETSWFGLGSRIIITTRDGGLLNRCRVKNVYKVKCLDGMDSVHMFNKIAFGDEVAPLKGFEQLSIRASRLAHGLPSALQAYALFFRGKTATPMEWEEALHKLEISLDGNLLEIMKICYNDLPEPHQNVLLNVACLFNGDSLQRITSLLDGSIPERSLWIRVLAEKSFITISCNRYVTMSKLVEEMGREIMRSIGKYLEYEEVCDTLPINKGTSIQNECMSFIHRYEMNHALSMNFNLKFLKVYKHVDYREPKLQLIQESPDMLCTTRLLHWDAFPYDTVHRFNPNFLVELSLRNSNLETLWTKKQVFYNLKILDVTGSKYLKRLPDLSKITTLEELMLEHCTMLEGIPESIGKRPNLKKLRLSNCGGRKGPLHVVIWRLSSHQPIRLEFPDLEIEMTKLTDISIEGHIRFEFSPCFRGETEYISLKSEQEIPIRSMPRVQQTPQLLSKFTKSNLHINIRRFNRNDNSESVTLIRFPDFPDLKELKLVNLSIQKIPDEFCHLEFIEKLDLSGNDFENLPTAMNSLPRLRTLCLQNCYKLKELPDLTQLHTLTLSNCMNLRSLVKLSFTSQSSRSYCLIELSLENCNGIESLSDQLRHFTKLAYLNLSGHNFETLPSNISDLTSLVSLCLNNCKKLKTVEELPPNLQFVESHGCDSLDVGSLEYLKERPNKEAHQLNSGIKETEMLSSVWNYLVTRTRQTIRLPKITYTLLFLVIPIYITLVTVLISFLLRGYK